MPFRIYKSYLTLLSLVFLLVGGTAIHGFEVPITHNGSANSIIFRINEIQETVADNSKGTSNFQDQFFAEENSNEEDEVEKRSKIWAKSKTSSFAFQIINFSFNDQWLESTKKGKKSYQLFLFHGCFLI